MAIILDTDVIRISILGTSSGQAIVNVLHYYLDGAGGNSVNTTLDILTPVRLAFRAKVIAKLSDSYVAQEYRLVVIKGTEERFKPDGTPYVPKQFKLRLGDAGFLPGALAGDTGGVLGASLPTYVSATIRKVTGLAGREKRGRMAVGPLPETYTEATFQNLLTAAALTALTDTKTFVSDSYALAGAETLRPILFHEARLLRTSKNGQSPTDVSATYFTGVVSGETNRLVGSQVSRKERKRLGS